jgi:hypothetical protein
MSAVTEPKTISLKNTRLTVIASKLSVGSVLNRIIGAPWTLDTSLARRTIVGPKSGGAVWDTFHQGIPIVGLPS